MKKLVQFVHVSMDGYVGGPNGEMNWIGIDETMFDFVGERTNLSDSAIYGRKTFEMMEAYWRTAGDQPDATKHAREHGAWYKKIQKFVITRSMADPKKPDITLVGKDLVKDIHAIRNSGNGEILLFGSPGAGKSLAELDLIDEYWMFVNPVTIGDGMALFPRLKDRRSFRFTQHRIFSNGVNCVSYERVR